jgi:hypothetical protein
VPAEFIDPSYLNRSGSIGQNSLQKGVIARGEHEISSGLVRNEALKIGCGNSPLWRASHKMENARQKLEKQTVTQRGFELVVTSGYTIALSTL